MTGSYLMIDPEGMFFSNVNRKYKYSNPILQVGVDQAFSEIDFMTYDSPSHICHLFVLIFVY